MAANKHLMAPVLILALCLAGCATRFSPGTVRDEIETQRGAPPVGLFELNLGRVTTYLIKTALTTDTGETPFAGLKQMQLAIYETPEEAGPAIDVTRIRARGWEPVIRTLEPSSSLLILVRSGGGGLWSDDDDETIADLVVIGAGQRKVVYARLRGELKPGLVSGIADLFRGGGPDAVRQTLVELAEPGTN